MRICLDGDPRDNNDTLSLTMAIKSEGHHKLEYVPVWRIVASLHRQLPFNGICELLFGGIIYNLFLCIFVSHQAPNPHQRYRLRRGGGPKTDTPIPATAVHLRIFLSRRHSPCNWLSWRLIIFLRRAALQEQPPRQES